MARIDYSYKGVIIKSDDKAANYPTLGFLVVVDNVSYTVKSVYGSNGTALADLQLAHVKARTKLRLPVSLPAYLRMLHSFTTEAQYDAWLKGQNRPEDWLITTSPTTAKVQLEAYQCSLDCGTLVYYHNGKWYASNVHTATASTVAELLTAWAERDILP